MINHLDFMYAHNHKSDSNKFNDLEIAKFKRVVDYFETTLKDDVYLSKGRSDFYNFFTQHDKRRNTDFLKTFPEYTNFFEQCKKLTVNHISPAERLRRREEARKRIMERKNKKEII